jgi:hypothetical protein
MPAGYKHEPGGIGGLLAERTHDEAGAIYAGRSLKSCFADTVKDILVQLGQLWHDALVHKFDNEFRRGFRHLVRKFGGRPVFGVKTAQNHRHPVLLGWHEHIKIREKTGSLP